MSPVAASRRSESTTTTRTADGRLRASIRAARGRAAERRAARAAELTLPGAYQRPGGNDIHRRVDL